MLTTSGTYPWSFVTQIFHNGQPSRGGDRTFYPNRNISIFVSVSSFDKEIRIESAQLLFLMCIHRLTEKGEGQPGQHILLAALYIHVPSQEMNEWHNLVSVFL